QLHILLLPFGRIPRGVLLILATNTFTAECPCASARLTDGSLEASGCIQVRSRSTLTPSPAFELAQEQLAKVVSVVVVETIPAHLSHKLDSESGTRYVAAFMKGRIDTHPGHLLGQSRLELRLLH